MPKLAGVNLLGFVLAAVAIYLITYVWYALLFTDVFQAAEGIVVPEDAEPEMGWMMAGMIIPFVLSFGMGWILVQTGSDTFQKAIMTGLIVAVFIAVGVQSYDLIYRPNHSVPGLLMHGGSHVITLLVAAIVHSFFVSKD